MSYTSDLWRALQRQMVEYGVPGFTPGQGDLMLIVGPADNKTLGLLDVTDASDGALLTRKSGATHGLVWAAPPLPTIRPGVGFQAADVTSTKTLTSGTTFAHYLGRAPGALVSVSLRYRVTTAASSITWAELAIAKGAPSLAGGANLTRLGFTDVSGVVNSTGRKTTAVSLSGCAAGDELWVLFGNNATTAAILRAGLPDELQAGYQVSAAVRPSTMSANTAFTIEGASEPAMWLGWAGA